MVDFIALVRCKCGRKTGTSITGEITPWMKHECQHCKVTFLWRVTADGLETRCLEPLPTRRIDKGKVGV